MLKNSRVGQKEGSKGWILGDRMRRNLPYAVEVRVATVFTPLLTSPNIPQPATKTIQDEYRWSDADECKSKLLGAQEMIERKQREREVGLRVNSKISLSLDVDHSFQEG